MKLSKLGILGLISLLSYTAMVVFSPLAYPKIVTSTPYQLELIYTPVHYQKVDHPVSMYTYFKEYTKPSVMGVIKKYTIGLPFTLLGMLQKEKPEVTLPGGEGDSLPKPLVLSKDEDKLLKVIAPKVNLAVDKKEGYITLSVTGSEPIQTAELAMKAQQLLSDEVVRFRTEKSQRELDYIQARYNEIKQEAESYQTMMATITDRSQNMLTSKSRIEMERIRSKYMVANTVYAEMAKQLEQAKMQVKKDTILAQGKRDVCCQTGRGVALCISIVSRATPMLSALITTKKSLPPWPSFVRSRVSFPAVSTESEL